MLTFAQDGKEERSHAGDAQAYTGMEASTVTPYRTWEISELETLTFSIGRQEELEEVPQINGLFGWLIGSGPCIIRCYH